MPASPGCKPSVSQGAEGRLTCMPAGQCASPARLVHLKHVDQRSSLSISLCKASSSCNCTSTLDWSTWGYYGLLVNPMAGEHWNLPKQLHRSKGKLDLLT